MIDEIEKGHLGATFDSFLQEQGIEEEVNEAAIKRVIAWQIAQIMEEKNINKVEMARRLATSRAQLNRLLDPNNTSVTLETLTKAARAVGRSLKLELV